MSHYVPKPDPEGVNSPLHDHPLRDLAILISGFLGIILVLYITLGWASDWIVSRININDEIKYLRSWKFNPDSGHKQPIEIQRLNRLVNERFHIDLKVEIICDETPNAFALPGAQIWLTKGLMSNIESENGLMFILGHEVGHILSRDHLQGIGRNLVTAILFSLLNLQSDLASPLGGLNNVLSRKYSQSQENAADNFGLDLVQKHYGHAYGAEEFFKKLLKKESAIEKQLSKWTSSHPDTESRLKKITEVQSKESERVSPTRPQRPIVDWATEVCGN